MAEYLEEPVQRLHAHYREGRDHSAEWRDTARESFDFEIGDQWSDEDREHLKDDDRPAVTIDRISRTLQSVVGTQINNRQETRYIPRELGDVKVNEILTSAAEWVRDETDAEDEESDAFNDLLVCGMGWTQTSLEYIEDPDGKIVIERVDPLWMYWDPSARKKNLTDRRWQLYVKTYNLEEFQALWPDADPDAAAAPWDDAIDEDDTGVREHVYPQDAYKEGQRASRERRPIRVGFEEYWKFETFWRVGESAMMLSDTQYEALKDQLAARGIKAVKQRQKRYYKTVVAGNVLLEEGPAIFPTGFSFHCMTGRRDRNRNYWFGLVETMKDPQRWGNKFFSQILDILNKNSKGGVIAEKAAVDDQRDFEEKWARPDAVHWVRPGALANNQIMPKPMATFPSGLDNLMSFSLDSVHEVTGVSLEALGLANRDQPNILENSRKQAGLTILAVYFDSIRRYRKLQGRMMMYLIQNYISDGRLIRITGNQADAQFIPLLKDQTSGRYDTIVDESPTSPNQKEKVFSIMQAMMPSLVKMGVPLPPELLDHSPLPSTLVQKWKEQIQKSNQLPPEVQQQLQKLGEENAQLKQKREETMAGLALKQQESQLKIEQAQAELEMKAQEMQSKREETLAQIQIKREQAAQDINLTREKIQAELEMKAVELKEEIELEREKAQAEVEIEIAKIKAKESERTALHKDLSKNAIESIHIPKKKVVVKRDSEGFIEEFEVDTIQ